MLVVLQETWGILFFFYHLWIFMCAQSLSKASQWSNLSWTAEIWYFSFDMVWGEWVACLYVQLIILINLKLLVFFYLQFTEMALNNSSSDNLEDWFLAILFKALCSFIQISVASCETLHCMYMQAGATEILWIPSDGCTFLAVHFGNSRGLFSLNGCVFVMKRHIDNFTISVWGGASEHLYLENFEKVVCTLSVAVHLDAMDSFPVMFSRMFVSFDLCVCTELSAPHSSEHWSRSGPQMLLQVCVAETNSFSTSSEHLQCILPTCG